MLRFLCSFFSFLACFLFWGHDALALVVSPPVLEYSANPGDALIDTVRVYNDENRSVTVYLSTANALDSGDEVGTPRFYSANEDIDGQAMAKWFAFERAPFVLKPGETFSQPFSINVPANAQPGGHYGALVFSTSRPSSGSAVGISSELAVLFLVNVAGDSQVSAVLSGIEPATDRQWYETLPKEFIVRVENTGSTHIKPIGGVTITNILGMTAEYLPLNRTGSNVLPRTIRRFATFDGEVVTVDTTSLQDQVSNFGLGRYTAKVLLGYGSDGKTIEGSYTFYVFPWKLLLVVFSTMLVVFGIFLLIKKLAKKPRLHQL